MAPDYITRKFLLFTTSPNSTLPQNVGKNSENRLKDFNDRTSSETHDSSVSVDPIEGARTLTDTDERKWL